MGRKLDPSEVELYRAVDEVLFYVWDPIGVSRTPEARDEYQSYVPQVFGLLVKGSSEVELLRYFESVTEHMGLQANPEHDAEVVGILLRWHQVINERYA